MPSKNNQSNVGIKAITNQIENSFVVSSFIYTMNDKEKLEKISEVVKDWDNSILSHFYHAKSVKMIQEILES